jgi:hypothetical protein
VVGMDIMVNPVSSHGILQKFFHSMSNRFKYGQSVVDDYM